MATLTAAGKGFPIFHTIHTPTKATSSSTPRFMEDMDI